VDTVHENVVKMLSNRILVLEQCNC